jgi:hypothetical protein
LLLEEIRKSREALAKIERFYDRSLEGVATVGRTPEKAIVLADLLAKYYTCLETIFLRISQFFENSLSADHWHADLLRKMTLSIGGVREAVLRDSTQALLLELLKFRHFTRYYYDISYDWDRLDYLMRKFAEVRPALHEDLDGFVRFLQALDADGVSDGVTT